MKYLVSLLNKSNAVTGSAKDACPIKAVVEPSESLKNRSKKPVKESSNGKKIMIESKLIKVEKVTRPISVSVIFSMSVMKYKSGLSKTKANKGTNTLKNTFPRTTRFLDDFPP